MKIRSLVGFALLFVFTVWLYFVTIYNTYQTQYVFLIVFSFFIIGSFFALYYVFRDELIKRSEKTLKLNVHGIEFLMVFIGAIITYIVHHYLGAGAVLASAFVGLMAGFFIKKYAVPIFCGSFVGMSSPLLLGLFPFILASLLASLVFILVKDMFNGYGGKLGTIALIGALITTFVLGDALDGPPPFTMTEQIVIFILSSVAAVITYSVSVRLKQGPVIASALVGIVAGALFPLLNDFGITLAIVAFGASFVGMSSPSRLPDERYIVVAGILFGLIYVFSAPYFNGAGGKLGTIAFASTLSVGGLKIIYNRYLNKPHQC